MYLRERNQTVLGILGLALTVVALAVALNIGRVSSLLNHGNYTADFSRAGGIRTGDDVCVRGVRIGEITKVALNGDRVRISFSVQGTRLGNETRASVKSANALGRKFLALAPAGAGVAENIPLSRTERPYDVTDALGDLTSNTEKIDVDDIAGSFDVLSETFKGTSPSLGDSLSGVKGLSETIAARDKELKMLLHRTDEVTGVLADRSEAITRIVANGEDLFKELQVRRLILRELLNDIQAAATAVRGVMKENETVMRPTLLKLGQVSDILMRNQENVEFALEELGPYARSVGESVGGGPFYFAYVANLAASNVAPIIPDLIRQDG